MIKVIDIRSFIPDVGESEGRTVPGGYESKRGGYDERDIGLHTFAIK